jgi:hypothetical protein
VIFHEIRLVGGLFEKKYIDQRALNKKHILREENNIKSPNCVFCGKHHLISSVSKPTLHSSSWQFNWKIYLSIYLTSSMSNADVYLHIKNDNVDPSRSMALCDQMLSAPVI